MHNFDIKFYQKNQVITNSLMNFVINNPDKKNDWGVAINAISSRGTLRKVRVRYSQFLYNIYKKSVQKRVFFLNSAKIGVGMVGTSNTFLILRA